MFSDGRSEIIVCRILISSFISIENSGNNDIYLVFIDFTLPCILLMILLISLSAEIFLQMTSTEIIVCRNNLPQHSIVCRILCRDNICLNHCLQKHDDFKNTADNLFLQQWFEQFLSPKNFPQSNLLSGNLISWIPPLFAPLLHIVFWTYAYTNET